ncbi:MULTISPECIES: carbohydrate ABC transporter permease [Halocynthiibacter]|uniref:Sugar ABC transporter permease n=1 Tax=Halocynthiibacter halioticoli TaxID=2986804 RepID=A0AAE3LPK5_9RHOB|nr:MULTISPECIES: sugar ABC transporter permease [Halocynthiibacter]MCV6823512.1 sugar ABC transporter permease [Halocynthiibacter halioticoli]MCW4056513.1 sugar ABC transporter permease [Halocynthiibacter sp. SDUM655004]MDE0590522.1 sugar ABC transporter permease [Halocynthiibacter sp. C4]
MNFKTFAAFVGPSVIMMILFIAFPLASVLKQSFYNTKPIYETVEVESCSPGFPDQICVTEKKSVPKLDDEGNIIETTEFVGLQSYSNVLELERAWNAVKTDGLIALQSIDFWKALRFTLTFTLITLPLVLAGGLGIALMINNATSAIKGPVIFLSLLPFIITPVIGALSINWLFRGDGILTAFIEWYLGRDVSLFAQAWTIELLMMLYRVWHVAPFAGIVFYAGLQTVNTDALESAVIDGASRWQRLKYVVIPHLTPLIVFVSMIHLMDSYRVFEEVVGFSSQGYVISLQWLTYDFLVPDQAGNRSVSRASASAMITMIGIAILLVPLLRRTWNDHKGGH